MIKILITGGNGMLAHDFKESLSGKFDIYSFDSSELNIINYEDIEKKIIEVNPSIILNLAAYTNVDEAEGIGMKKNYNVNTLGIYNLSKVTNKYNIDFITISTDYVFSGDNEKGYSENEKCEPINQYGMAKYLGEKLAFNENKNSIIIRTSWLYGGGKKYKNFVNTMINLGNKLDSLNIINDQFGNPTNAKDISEAIGKVINYIDKYRGQLLHFSNTTEGKGISWYDFTKEIFNQAGIDIKLSPCNTSDFPTKAKRPKFSKLINNSDVKLRNWKEGLMEYIKKYYNIN